jgi:hypothetical protein
MVNKKGLEEGYSVFSLKSKDELLDEYPDCLNKELKEKLLELDLEDETVERIASMIDLMVEDKSMEEVIGADFDKLEHKEQIERLEEMMEDIKAGKYGEYREKAADGLIKIYEKRLQGGKILETVILIIKSQHRLKLII